VRTPISPAQPTSKRRVIEELSPDWCRLDERIAGLSDEIEELAKRDA
jgi:hypothetical protein